MAVKPLRPAPLWSRTRVLLSNLRVKTAWLQPVGRTICKLLPTATFLLPALPASTLCVFFFFFLGVTVRALSFSFLSPSPCSADSCCLHAWEKGVCVVWRRNKERGCIVSTPPRSLRGCSPPGEAPVTCSEHLGGVGGGRTHIWKRAEVVGRVGGGLRPAR